MLPRRPPARRAAGPLLRLAGCRRRASVAPEPAPPRRIAVLGGGLAGLSTAYYLAKRLPASTRIVLYEADDRLGGWIRTDRLPVDVAGCKGVVGFERGPRTLSSLQASTWRFDDLVLYDLALDLGLQLVSPPPAPRYIYHGRRLVCLPPTGGLARLLSEPLFWRTVWAAPAFYLRRFLLPRPLPTSDLSVARWLRDITMSRPLVDSLASAMAHGIYGGDVDQLSARCVLEQLYWPYYMPSPGPDHRLMPAREEALLDDMALDTNLADLARRPKSDLLHMGPNGMESLVTALAGSLAAQPNVEIRTGDPVTGLTYDPAADQVQVRTGGAAASAYERVIATLPANRLARLADGRLPSLDRSPAVSVMTVNLWYPREDIKPPGLGYLIPRSLGAAANPERALGVFFDSDVAAARTAEEPAGTKLFVLLGGHLYDDNHPPPSEDEAVAQAKALLERQLAIPASTPCFATARLARDCIPQPLVGHHERMAVADDELRTAFAGRLAVAGGSYSAVGAMAALRAGYEAAKLTAGPGGWSATGLESLRLPPVIARVPVHKITTFRNLAPARA